MSYLVDTPSIKKRFCNHDFKKRYPNGSNRLVEYCIKCNAIKKQKQKNESLIPFLRPASKQSKQILVAVAAFVAEYQFMTDWLKIVYDGWRLPCTKDKYDWCGIWQTLGCLNKNIHEMFGKGRSVFIKHYQRSCYRPSCKECYLKWIARQANRATSRVEAYAKRTGKKPIHMMLMVNSSQHHLPHKLLRKRMMEILEIARWEGGAVIFHPFKFNENSRQWYYSPHFHLVGFGERDRVSRAFGRYGWYVKLGEERKSVFQTFCYLLSHCGIKKGHHVVTWIGELSYSKVPSEKEPKITGCPVCWCPLKPVWHEGVHPKVPPDRHFEGLLDDDNCWHPVETMQALPRLVPFEYLINTELFDYEDKDLELVQTKAAETRKCYVCSNVLVFHNKSETNQQNVLFFTSCKTHQITLWNSKREDACFSCYKAAQECLQSLNQK